MELEELYKHIQPRVYAFFYVKTANKEAAEDLTQEVFYQALKGFNTFSGKSTVQTWVFAIAKNVLKKHFRANTYKDRLTEQLSQEEEQSLSPEDHFIKKEKQTNLVTKINQLDERSKEVVTLRIYGELSFKEIGQLMDKSENYARVTFHRAKLKLQKEEGYDGQ